MFKKFNIFAHLNIYTNDKYKIGFSKMWMPGLDPGTAARLLYSVAGRWGQCGSRQ